jgi:hypothetical protein
MCDLIFSGVFERHPRLRLAIVDFELAWVRHLLSTMDYTYRERHGETIYRFQSLPSRRLAKAGDGMLPSDFFRRNVVLSFQEMPSAFAYPPPFPPPLAGSSARAMRSANRAIGAGAARRRPTGPESDAAARHPAEP